METSNPIVNLVTQVLLVVFILGLLFLATRTMLTMSSLVMQPLARFILAVPLLRKIVTAQRGNPTSPDTQNVETTSPRQSRRAHSEEF